MTNAFSASGLNFIIGTGDDDRLVGTLDDEFIFAADGDDTIAGNGGADTIFAGAGRDTIAYDGASIGDPVDSLLDFDVAEDRFLLPQGSFGVTDPLSFVNALAEDLPAEGANVIVLQDTDDDGDPATGFNARSAARLIGEESEDEGAGFFVYFNSGLQVNRLVFSEDLSDGEAGLTVLAAVDSVGGANAIAQLADFGADNFIFGEQLNGTAGDDTLLTGAGDDTVAGRFGDDAVFAGAGDDDVRGNAGDDTLGGGEGEDRLFGSNGNDILDGGAGQDRLTGGVGADAFSFSGDPFDGADVSAPGRQIVGGEDEIQDFSIAQDSVLLDVTDGGFDIDAPLAFQSLDATAADADIAKGTNVIVLTNADNDGDPATPFLAGTAANQIADLVETDGAGVFVYFNSALDLNRLVYSENLNDAEADLKIVARLNNATGEDAIDALSAFTAANFALNDTGDLFA